ncbi:unnamed protein product [Camellia sinensis]
MYIITASIDEVSSNTKPLIRQIWKLPKRVKKLMEMIPHLSHDFQTFPEGCFYLATSYSLAGKRTEAYALYCRAHSLANDALKKFKSLTTADQVMIKKLKMLYDDSRSNSCIEHATGIRGGEGDPSFPRNVNPSVRLLENCKKMEKRKEEVSSGKMMDHQMSEEIYTQRRGVALSYMKWGPVGFDMFGKCVGFVKFNADVVDKATGKKVLCLHMGQQ